MLSKIQSLFRKPNPEDTTMLDQSIPRPSVNSLDAQKCPFSSKSAKMSESTCPYSGKGQQEPPTSEKDKEKHTQKNAKKNAKKSNEENTESESEDEAPQGGCPFMGGSDKKKNPGLEVLKEGYDEPFVSKFKYYLSGNKLLFDFSKKKSKKQKFSRQVFDKYPIYLQHTLFFTGDDYKKVRTLQCCSRFMPYEELREKGNKYFNKGQFHKAIQYYERALSLFRWLEYNELSDTTVQSEKLDKSFQKSSQKSFQKCSDSDDEIQRIQMNLNGSDELNENQFKDVQQLKSQFKQFFITYSDSNVQLYNGEEMTETADIDMRKSLLIQIYLNMASAYMNLNHFSLAEEILKDALTLSENVSQIYLRMAQVLLNRKDSTVKQLEEAKKLIEKALRMQPNEKIFTTANTNILKMLNLHDAVEVYNKCSEKLIQRIAKKQVQENSLINSVYQRAKEINQIQQEIIKQGKNPKENTQDKVLSQTTEMKILDRMRLKYLRVIQFYTEAKNEEQVKLAKVQIQQILQITCNIKFIHQIKLQEKGNQLGGIKSKKIQRRINVIKTRMAENIYNQGKFNFTVLEWAIKEIVKEEKLEEEKIKLEEKKKLEEKNKQNVKLVQNESDGIKSNWKNKLPLLMMAIPMVIVISNIFVF